MLSFKDCYVKKNRFSLHNNFIKKGVFVYQFFEQKLRMGADKWIRVNSLCASVLCLVRCGVTLYTLVFSRMRYHCVRFVLKCRTTFSLLLNQQLTQTGSSRNFSKIGPAPKPLWAQSGWTWKQCLENVPKKQNNFYWGGGALL